MTARIEWDEERGRHVNRGLEEMQARQKIATLFVRTIDEEGDLAAVAAATLEHTPATPRDIVFGLMYAVQNAAWNGSDESDRVTVEVAELLTAWLARAAAVG